MHHENCKIAARVSLYFEEFFGSSGASRSVYSAPTGAPAQSRLEHNLQGGTRWPDWGEAGLAGRARRGEGGKRRGKWDRATLGCILLSLFFLFTSFPGLARPTHPPRLPRQKWWRQLLQRPPPQREPASTPSKRINNPKITSSITAYREAVTRGLIAAAPRRALGRAQAVPWPAQAAPRGIRRLASGWPVAGRTPPGAVGGRPTSAALSPLFARGISQRIP